MSDLDSSLPPPEEPEEIPPFLLSTTRLPTPTSSLCKQRTWSPDTYREEAWARRKGTQIGRRRRTKSVTDEDLDELKACIELGFGFDSPEVDPKLSETFPALGFYYTVINNMPFNDAGSNSAEASDGGSSSISPADSPRPPTGSINRSIFSPGENPRVMKARLRQWAQVVACSVRQSSPVRSNLAADIGCPPVV
ncbi:hypothetical protein SAY86_018403 [Trapa natans]|uniref:Uncharacterized protein n=1 Tax=Trapa natans TaxID=22666 RepID=A0AAN7LEZ3_TRANT|nr:hypothetical protein SAY86_018403 [Trapa natans]